MKKILVTLITMICLLSPTSVNAQGPDSQGCEAWKRVYKLFRLVNEGKNFLLGPITVVGQTIMIGEGEAARGMESSLKEIAKRGGPSWTKSSLESDLASSGFVKNADGCWKKPSGWENPCKPPPTSRAAAEEVLGILPVIAMIALLIIFVFLASPLRKLVPI